MKFIYSITILFFILCQVQDIKLKGKYRMEYEKNMSKNNCIIVFDESSYEKQLPNGKIIKGNIEYQNNFIKLSDEKSSLQMSLPKREVKNDTIYFRTLDSLEVIKQKKPLMIFTGKLIKIK
ncbi:MAG: hypothetical protein ACK4IZ_02205 [Flavobacterium sp.]|uniref:hypothetical protein n=1 Tax=Flavobacterium TaxID=237 RepID=UPI00391DA72F